MLFNDPRNESENVCVSPEDEEDTDMSPRPAAASDDARLERKEAAEPPHSAEKEMSSRLNSTEPEETGPTTCISWTSVLLCTPRSANDPPRLWAWTWTDDW